ncbi:hypothetical protein Q1695_009822 [Nippostrongylus brasiliensis]|nr:hypothetical protein Q1695_009822 [Nippostrongylus brasiliensis]
MIWITIIAAIFNYFFLKMWIRRRSLPPGPFPLPLIGNIHQMVYGLYVRKLSMAEIMQEWVPKYGKVITFWFGPIPTVNICDHQLAVDAMVKKGSNFADKISLYIARVIRNGRGVIFSNGPEWLEQRRFALHTLRNFGLGRNLIEERIMYEFNICCDELDRRLNAGEKSIEPHTSFDLLVGNIINRMLFTERFGKNEAESFFALKKEMDDVMEHFTHLDLLIEESIVEWPLIKQRVNQVMEPIKAVLAFVGNQVDQRKRAISDGSHVLHGEGDDFVDAFLIQMAKEKTSGKPHSFDDEMLLITLLDLWIAGQETTVTTLYWSFAYLLRNLDVMSRVEQELLSVTKGERPLSLADKPSTPYYNATLTEIHRCASLVPLIPWRVAAEDTTVGPYKITKGTAIASQNTVIMNDEKFFKHHEQFNPDRYLNGNKLDQMVAPFGLGKRSCLGESLARAELYLIIGNLLLRYKISPDPDFMPSLKATNNLGTMRRPRSYHICFEQR